MYSRLVTALLFALVAAAPTFKHPAPYELIEEETSKHATISKRHVGGVCLSDGRNFTGHVWHGVFPLNTCINLNDYAGKVLSFRPDRGTECYLMQGQCDSENYYADLYHNSTNVGDLSGYSWISDTESYQCMKPIWYKKG